MQFALDPGRPAHFIRPISSELGDNEKELKQPQQQQQQYKKETLQGKTQNPKFFLKKEKRAREKNLVIDREREVAGGWMYTYRYRFDRLLL